MTVPDSLARIYASAPADDDYIETLEIAHPLFTRRHLIANEAYPFDAILEDGSTVTFTPFPFSARLPAQSGQGNQDLVLAIDNCDQSLLDELELAASGPTDLVSAIYRRYVRSDLSAPAFVLPALAMAEIAATAEQVSATATRTDVLNRPFPSVIYTVAAFPGLDR